jgi:large subunit ribosomal protein L43
MNSFIKTFLPAFAKRNPQIEMFISPRPRKHPVIRAHYINGAQRSICARNMESQTVREKAELLRDASGEKNRKLNKPVTSINESVRGIWSPFHGDKIKI